MEVSDTCIIEYDKEHFLMALKEQMGFYGLHSLFSMPDISRKTYSLVEDACLYSLSQVRDEYDTRMVPPGTTFELDSTGYLTTTEISASILIKKRYMPSVINTS